MNCMMHKVCKIHILPPWQLSVKEAEDNMKELLIELVKGRQFIYGKCHPMDYHTNGKAESWDEISKILNIPSE